MEGIEIFVVIIIIIGVLAYNKTIDFKRFLIDNDNLFKVLKEDRYFISKKNIKCNINSSTIYGFVL